MLLIQHDSLCTEPLNEHSGLEPCIRVVFQKEEGTAEEIQTAYYKRGPQGNSIPDTRADYLARYGPTPKGPLESAFEDRRDNRDPGEVGEQWLKRLGQPGTASELSDDQP